VAFVTENNFLDKTVQTDPAVCTKHHK